MNSRPVAFVSLGEYDNLGVGYLAGVLSEAKYLTRNIDVTIGKENILGILREIKPLIVGFSVIYEDYIDIFADMIRFFRDGGIECHFVAGGFHASLRHEELFRIIPELDSVVRFEGEYTLLELADCIREGRDWKAISGIAYRNGTIVITNPLRPLQKDLDLFPFPVRAPLREYAFGRKFATLIAGRGCIHNCSFCNIREFYHRSGSPVKRIRKAEEVVSEMESLHKREGCPVFLFSDDDFPVIHNGGNEWIAAFCRELSRKNLNKRLLWKISCRPDEVGREDFSMMQDHGLFFVFLGIEEGTDDGLALFNKNMTVAESLRGIGILKELSIKFDYGFMLFNPSSTFALVRENLDFLTRICGDGYTPVTFLKVQPYFETRIEKILRGEGRLKGRPGSLDYDFFDKSLDHYYHFVAGCLQEWLRGINGLLNVIRWAQNYLAVYPAFFQTSPEFSAIAENVRKITSRSNLFLLDTLKELSGIFETGKYDSGDYRGLRGFKENIDTMHDRSRARINHEMILLLRNPSAEADGN